MEIDNKTILNKLNSIKAELDYIKENMVEKDDIMTSDEFEAYRESLDEKNLVSIEDAKEELGL